MNTDDADVPLISGHELNSLSIDIDARVSMHTSVSVQELGLSGIPW